MEAERKYITKGSVNNGINIAKGVKGNYLKLFFYITGLISFIFSSCITPQETTATEEKPAVASQPNRPSATQPVSIAFEATFADYIRTVLFYKKGLPNSYPIIELGGPDVLTLEWDELYSKGSNRYQYTIEHFGSNWEPSNLLKSDYVDGMFVDFVTDFGYSNNTYSKFTHYRLEFPTASMRPKISGNYILRVFKDNENEPVITRRFYVFEQLTGIIPNVHQPTYARYRDAHQEVDLRVDLASLQIFDPYKDIKIVMRQNWRWDNQITNLRPIFIQDRVLNYNYEEGNIFQGLNEFRMFDMRDFRFKGQGIRGYTFDTIFHTDLMIDEDRSYQAYYFYTDQNGFYTTANRYGNNAALDADYATVRFDLDPAFNDYGDVYVFGGLTNWQIDNRFKLTKSSMSSRLEATVLLKQGFYDYMYVSVKDGVIKPAALEGSHWQTENNYHVFVYQRTPDMLYDRLVGYVLLNSQFK